MSPTIPLILAVALGGSAGALARFGIYLIVHGKHAPPSPWTTFLINIIGCLLLGLILGLAAKRTGSSDLWRTFLTVGVLGAFTTFSTYAADALKLIHDGRVMESFAYITLSAALGLAAAAAGQELGTRLAP